MASKSLGSFPSGKRVLYDAESDKWKGIYVRVNAKKTDMTFYVTYQANGKAQMEKVGKASEGMTPKKARDLRSDILAEIRQGDHKTQKAKPSGNETIMDAWRRFERENLTSRVDYHKPKFENHVQPYFKATPLVRVDESAFAVMRKHFIENTTMAHGTIVQVFDTVKVLLKLAHSAGMLERLPDFRNLSIENHDNERERYLDPAKGEIAKFFELIRGHSKGEQLYALCRMSLVTGMRQGEILKLRGVWVDMTNLKVDLPGYYKSQRVTKNGKPRTVFFDPVQAEMLWRLGYRKDDKLVFATKSGKPIYKGNIKRVVDKAAMPFNAELRERREEAERDFEAGRISAEEMRGENEYYHKWAVVFHTLRHTFATVQVSNGVPLDIVGERLGHQSEKMYRRYAKFIPKSAQEYQEVLHSIISESGV